MTSSNLLDVSALTYNAIDSRYGFVSYNGIDLYVNANKTMFNASKLTHSLKCHLTAAKSLSLKSMPWYGLTQAYPDLFEEVKGKGTKAYKGWYASIELLQFVTATIEPVRGLAWLRDEPWQEQNAKGFLYLLQPPRWIGTNVFKIGETKDMLDRLRNRDYGKGTQVLGTIRVSNRAQAEHILIKHFKDHGGILREGHEYFELAGLGEAQRLFTTAPLGNLYDRSFREVVELYRTGEWIYGEVIPSSILFPTRVEQPSEVHEDDDSDLDDDVFAEA